jgi:archaellum biogenesis ATPase FlaH
MDAKLLLVKSITLLYRESLLKNKSENSADLVRTILQDIKTSDISLSSHFTNHSVVKELKETALEMCNNPLDHVYDVQDLLQRVKVNTGDDEATYEAIVSGLSDIAETSIKRTIVNLRKSIMNHFREQEIQKVIDTAAVTFKFKRDSIKDVNQFVGDIIAQLEPLQLTTSYKDPAMIDEIDLEDDGEIVRVLTDGQKTTNGNKVYKTGWTALNRMLQGGFRPGEFWLISALQHKYKSSFVLHLFMHIALYNKPFTEDPEKKPLLIYISAENQTDKNFIFLYQTLMYNETKMPVDLNVDVEQMKDYIKSRLLINGFRMKILKINPSDWSYRGLCNKVIELEAEGYNIEVVVMDYLAMIPTVGCITTGPMGTDKRDLIRRVRNFMSTKNITFITPHQISMDGKTLIRGGVPEDQFVKEIADKGYYEGSKQLDQEIDGGILLHLFKHNKETYLAVQREKHRIPTILEDEYKYFLLKFDKGMPLKDDDIYAGEDQSYRRLPTASNVSDADLFEFKN